MIPLIKVTDMSFRRNEQGRLLGWGTCPIPSRCTSRCTG
jgi:hypothetical protein